MLILKILTPKVLKAIMKYVFERNDLDHKMDAVDVRLSRLELDAHPQREFVTCECCKKKLRESQKSDDEFVTVRGVKINVKEL